MIRKEEKVIISNLMIEAFEDFLMYIRNVDFGKFDVSVGVLLKQMNTTCTQFSQTALHLILEDALWETEILLRSVLEGTIKLLYIACEPESIQEKMVEFTQVLPHISGTKRNQRVGDILNSVDLSNKNRDLEIYSKMLEHPLPEIDENLNRKAKNDIKRKWDFISMLESIQNSEIKEIVNTEILKHPYGMMSNIVHLDYDGLNFIFERHHRSEKEDSVNTLQMCRQYSDIYHLIFARTISICIAYGTDYTELVKYPLKHRALLNKLDDISKQYT